MVIISTTEPTKQEIRNKQKKKQEKKN